MTLTLKFEKLVQQGLFTKIIEVIVERNDSRVRPHPETIVQDTNCVYYKLKRAIGIVEGRTESNLRTVLNKKNWM